MKKNLYVMVCALCALLSFPAAAQVPSYVPTDGLVGWWPFNGNANDESGNGNDGTVDGATLTEDRFGIANSAFLFNESSIQVTDANSINSDLSSQLTLNAWVTLEGFPSGFAPIISKDGPVFHQYELFIEPSSVGFWSTDVYDNAVTQTFDLQNWYMITVSVNSGEIKYYINGALIASNQASNTDMIGSDAQLEFGADSPNGIQYHDGKIDDIAIYNRALTEEEIQNLYTGTTPEPCTALPSNLQQGLVGYWPFCGNANDESGNGNDGVVNGATLTEDRFEYSNKAYQFNGDTDDITIEVSSPVEINRSISFWAKVDSGAMNVNPSRNIIALGNDFNVTFGDWGDNGKSAISVHSGIQWVADTTVTDDGNWHFYSVIMTNGNSDSLAFYQDGELLNGRINFGGFNCAQSNSVLKIGSGYAEGDNLNGTLDDIAIWNRALTPEEVQELYTLDACTFTIYDTVYTYETIYDTVTTYVTVTDTLLIDITFTGIEGQPSWLNTVTVFPNPASDQITIDYGNFALMAGYNTVITDAAGATVYSSAVNSQQAYIDINTWGATGVYYMTIYDASGAAVAVRHIVLQ